MFDMLCKSYVLRITSLSDIMYVTSKSIHTLHYRHLYEDFVSFREFFAFHPLLFLFLCELWMKSLTTKIAESLTRII